MHRLRHFLRQALALLVLLLYLAAALAVLSWVLTPGRPHPYSHYPWR